MANIINTARITQRTVAITLLDIKNSFGEVHNNLISEVLRYHHVPDQIQQLIQDLYSNFQTSVVTESFRTPFIIVGRDVLKGVCLTPLTF